jgi:hypothetical protein
MSLLMADWFSQIFSGGMAIMAYYTSFLTD